jgi:hypothetical protein
VTAGQEGRNQMSAVARLQVINKVAADQANFGNLVSALNNVSAQVQSVRALEHVTSSM